MTDTEYAAHIAAIRADLGFPADEAAVTYTYCGEPEPTDACERGGWCDYHLGSMPGGPSPWDLGQVVPFGPAR